LSIPLHSRSQLSSTRSSLSPLVTWPPKHNPTCSPWSPTKLSTKPSSTNGSAKTPSAHNKKQHQAPSSHHGGTKLSFWSSSPSPPSCRSHYCWSSGAWRTSARRGDGGLFGPLTTRTSRAATVLSRRQWAAGGKETWKPPLRVAMNERSMRWLCNDLNAITIVRNHDQHNDGPNTRRWDLVALGTMYWYVRRASKAEDSSLAWKNTRKCDDRKHIGDQGVLFL